MLGFDSDSDGNLYQVWQQDQANSCAVASTWMARNMIRQSTSAETEWTLAQSMFRTAVNNMFAPLGLNPNGPACFNPNAFAANQNTLANTLAAGGFYPDQLVRVYRSQHIKVNLVERSNPKAPFKLDAKLLSERTPALVAVYWHGGGGHAVIAVRKANSNEIVFLDPGDGKVNEQPNDGTYEAHNGSTGDIGVVLYLSKA